MNEQEAQQILDHLYRIVQGQETSVRGWVTSEKTEITIPTVDDQRMTRKILLKASLEELLNDVRRGSGTVDTADAIQSIVDELT